MTTQPNQDDVAAFMEELGFELHKYGVELTTDAAQFLYTTLQQSNRQLLDEVEESGPEAYKEHRDDEELDAAYNAGFNNANAQWHQAIQAIKKERKL